MRLAVANCTSAAVQKSVTILRAAESRLRKPERERNGARTEGGDERRASTAPKINATTQQPSRNAALNHSRRSLYFPVYADVARARSYARANANRSLATIAPNEVKVVCGNFTHSRRLQRALYLAASNIRTRFDLHRETSGNNVDSRLL